MKKWTEEEKTSFWIAANKASPKFLKSARTLFSTPPAMAGDSISPYFAMDSDALFVLADEVGDADLLAPYHLQCYDKIVGWIIAGNSKQLHIFSSLAHGLSIT